MKKGIKEEKRIVSKKKCKKVDNKLRFKDVLQKKILVSMVVSIVTIIALIANLGSIITFFMGLLSNPYTGLLITNQNNFSISHIVVIYNDGNKIDDYVTFQISVENPYVKIVKIEQESNLVANPSFTSGRRT